MWGTTLEEKGISASDVSKAIQQGKEWKEWKEYVPNLSITISLKREIDKSIKTLLDNES